MLPGFLRIGTLDFARYFINTWTNMCEAQRAGWTIGRYWTMCVSFLKSARKTQKIPWMIPSLVANSSGCLGQVWHPWIHMCHQGTEVPQVHGIRNNIAMILKRVRFWDVLVFHVETLQGKVLKEFQHTIWSLCLTKIPRHQTPKWE